MEDKHLTQALQPGADCPSIEELGRYRDDALAPAARRACEQHISGCANCRAELALLEAFVALEVRNDESAIVREGVRQLDRRRAQLLAERPNTAPEIRRRFSVAAFRPALALAAMLLTVAGGYYLTRPASHSVLVTDSDTTRSSEAVVILTPRGEVQSRPDRLEWRAVAGASSYRARIDEVDRHEVWSTDTTTTSATLPPAVLAQIVPGKTFVWRVTAYSAAHSPIAESAPERFRLAR
jgi:hypothetical protein